MGLHPTLLPAPAHTACPRLHSWRTLLNAIFSQLRTGSDWRFLPQEWPPWQTVYHYFRVFRRDGTWERLHTILRERLPTLGRTPSPAWAASRASRSRRRVAARGYGGGKKITGRKRHLLVDTEDLALKASAHTAEIIDRDGVKLFLTESIPTAFPRLRHVRLDTGYNGRDKGQDWIEKTFGWTAQIVAHPRRL